MTLQDELVLSYYQRISMLSETHGVWLVRHTQTGRLAVEKHPSVYHLEVYRQLMARPVANTPRIYAAVEDGSGLTVIEEYVSGTPLSVLLQNGPLPEHIAAGLTRQLCVIVSALHESDPPIVHRDIKPANILVSDSGTLTLLDFDAAKPWHGAADRDTRLIGTAGYAAPEQYGFAASSPRTDQYAIGVLMSTMVHGGFSRGALTQHPYDRIAERCTRIDPADRYASVQDIVAELDAIFQSPGSAPTRAQPAGRRIPWLPPGFRTLHPGHMLGMGLWYVIAVWIGATLEVRNVSPGELLVNRIFAVIGLLGATLLAGNYLDVWTVLGIAKLPTPSRRRLAAALAAFCFFVAMAVLAVIISDLLNL